jgi:hypothetical protein
MSASVESFIVAGSSDDTWSCQWAQADESEANDRAEGLARCGISRRRACYLRMPFDTILLPHGALTRASSKPISGPGRHWLRPLRDQCLVIVSTPTMRGPPRTRRCEYGRVVPRPFVSNTTAFATYCRIGRRSRRACTDQSGGRNLHSFTHKTLGALVDVTSNVPITRPTVEQADVNHTIDLWRGRLSADVEGVPVGGQAEVWFDWAPSPRLSCLLRTILPKNVQLERLMANGPLKVSTDVHTEFYFSIEGWSIQHDLVGQEEYLLRGTLGSLDTVDVELEKFHVIEFQLANFPSRLSQPIALQFPVAQGERGGRQVFERTRAVSHWIASEYELRLQLDPTPAMDLTRHYWSRIHGRDTEVAG